MEIKLHSWDINQAIEDYLKKNHKLDVDFSKMYDYPCFEFTEKEVVYKRHSNGKIKKHKDGYYLIDKNKTKSVEKCTEINDDACISFYVY